MPCNCAICTRATRFAAVIASRDVDALIAAVVELENSLGMTEDDLDHKNAILDGSWPSAVEQLEAALERAKGKREAR